MGGAEDLLGSVQDNYTEKAARRGLSGRAGTTKPHIKPRMALVFAERKGCSWRIHTLSWVVPLGRHHWSGLEHNNNLFTKDCRVTEWNQCFYPHALARDKWVLPSEVLMLVSPLLSLPNSQFLLKPEIVLRVTLQTEKQVINTRQGGMEKSEAFFDVGAEEKRTQYLSSHFGPLSRQQPYLETIAQAFSFSLSPSANSRGTHRLSSYTLVKQDASQSSSTSWFSLCGKFILRFKFSLLCSRLIALRH